MLKMKTIEIETPVIVWLNGNIILYDTYSNPNELNVPLITENSSLNSYRSEVLNLNVVQGILLQETAL